MVQLILAMLVTAATVMFAMANFHHVELSTLFGVPIRIRLIFLLGIAYLAGLVGSALYFMARGLRNRPHIEIEEVTPTSSFPRRRMGER